MVSGSVHVRSYMKPCQGHSDRCDSALPRKGYKFKILYHCDTMGNLLMMIKSKYVMWHNVSLIFEFTSFVHPNLISTCTCNLPATFQMVFEVFVIIL